MPKAPKTETTSGVVPFDLPVELALARPVTEVPPEAPGRWFEPKVDGWRCCLRTGRDARLFSRHGTDLSQAFSDIVAAAAGLPDAVLDGELLAVRPDGTLAFGLLQTRAGGRGPRPREGFQTQIAAFDLLAEGSRDLRALPLGERRAGLLAVLPAGGAIWPLPTTDSPDQAKGWFGSLGGGIEGCVVKSSARPYRGGHRSDWLKYRVKDSVSAVILGITPAATPASQSAVLGLPGSDGRLRAVGVSLPCRPPSAPTWPPACAPPVGAWPSCPEPSAGFRAVPRSGTNPWNPPPSSTSRWTPASRSTAATVTARGSYGFAPTWKRTTSPHVDGCHPDRVIPAPQGPGDVGPLPYRPEHELCHRHSTVRHHSPAPPGHQRTPRAGGAAVTHITSTLRAALIELGAHLDPPGAAADPDGTACEALRLVVAGAYDTADAGEEAGQLYVTPSVAELGHRPVWLRKAPHGITAGFPAEHC